MTFWRIFRGRVMAGADRGLLMESRRLGTKPIRPEWQRYDGEKAIAAKRRAEACAIARRRLAAAALTTARGRHEVIDLRREA